MLASSQRGNSPGRIVPGGVLHQHGTGHDFERVLSRPPGLGAVTGQQQIMKQSGIHSRLVQVNGAVQTGDLARIQGPVVAAAQSFVQGDRAEGNPNQAADRQPNGFEKASYLAIPTPPQRDSIPYVATATAGRLQRFEAGLLTIQRHPAGQLAQLRSRRLAAEPHRVAARDAITGMHQAVSKLAVCGQQEQAGGGDIQPSNADPAPLPRGWQRIENRGSARLIAARGHLPGRLVIEQVLVPPRLSVQPDGAPIQTNLALRPDPNTERRQLPIHGDSTQLNPALDFPARAVAAGGERLLQSVRQPGKQGSGRAGTRNGDHISAARFDDLLRRLRGSASRGAAVVLKLIDHVCLRAGLG